MRENPGTGLLHVYLPEAVLVRLDQLGEAGIDLLPIYEAVTAAEPPSQRGALWDALLIDPSRAAYPEMAADALHHLHRLLGPRDSISAYYHLVHAMASTLFVEAYASFHERLVEDSRTGEGAAERRRAKRLLERFEGARNGEAWEDVAPETPESAGVAAVLLSARIAEVNSVEWPEELTARAYEADRKAGKRDFPWSTQGSHYLAYAVEFGANLAMMAVGSGASWFDDHAEIPLESPRIDTYVDVDKRGRLFFECSGCQAR